MSKINVNTINEHTSGNGVYIPDHIIQVKSQFFDTQTSIQNTTDFTDTGLTLAITPSSTSSKILCMFYPTLSGKDNAYCALKMFRDSTEIGSSTQTGTGVECFAGATFDDTGNTSYGVLTVPMIFLDSPSTTSSVTYKVQASPMRTGTGSSTQHVYLNRSYNLGDDNQFRAVSNVILMEVGA